MTSGMLKAAVAGVSLGAALLAVPAQAALTLDWQRIGPVGASISALAVSPNWNTDSALFAGVRGNGTVYQTNTAGDLWAISRPAGMPTNISIEQLATSPGYRNGGADQVVFAAAPSNYGVYRSADSGHTWTAASLSGAIDRSTWDLFVSPAFTTDRTVAAATNSGPMLSTDGGATFTSIKGDLPFAGTLEIAMSPNYANDQTLFVGGNGTGIYKSVDGGAKWTAAGDGLPATPGRPGAKIVDVVISPRFEQDQTVYATVEGAGLFQSNDGGTTWSILVAQGQTGSFALSPNFANDQTMFLSGGTLGFSMSNDAGKTWTRLNMPPLALLGVVVSDDYADDGRIFALTPDSVFTAQVPEPATIGLLALGGMCILARRRRA